MAFAGFQELNNIMKSRMNGLIVFSFVVQMFVKAINLKAKHNSRAFEDSTQQMHSTSTLLHSDIIEQTRLQ